MPGSTLKHSPADYIHLYTSTFLSSQCIPCILRGQMNGFHEMCEALFPDIDGDFTCILNVFKDHNINWYHTPTV